MALVLIGSGFFAGPAPAAFAAPDRSLAAAPTTLVVTEPERALGAHLAVEYAGAVPAVDVESLVREVSRQLRQDSSPPARLLATTEAVCRRALTDYLARGVPLPSAR